MPVILATQEADIRRITVQSHPGHNSLRTLSRKTHQKIRGTGGVAQGIGPEFKTPYGKKKKKVQRIMWKEG
jgi:hypothetical protein